jgi:hypothetical protein
VIDLIDELEVLGDLAEPDPSWFECPILRRAEMLATIKQKGALDGRSVNLFSALERPPKSDLLELYLWENLYRPGFHYIYVTPDPSRYGSADWQPALAGASVAASLAGACTLFSNTLSWGESPPSERTYNAGFAVYTIEFDHVPLVDQLRIIWSGKLKRIDAELSAFRDYRGFEAVYSGSKSIHFHFIFDLRHLKHDLITAGNSSYRDNWMRDLPDALLRPAYGICWERLTTIFRCVAEVDDQPDQSLRRWEQLRRCPWALRQIRSTHPLGLPSDHRIPQVVLAEAIFQKTKRRATEWFHEPNSLFERCSKEQIRRRPKPLIEQDIAFTSRELDLFEQHAPETFRKLIGVEYPKFSRFEVNQTGFRCFFLNGSDDRNPSSFCEGNRDRIVLQGRHAFDPNGMTIGATPNQIFNWIASQHRDAGDPGSDDWITRRYKAAVHDRESLTRFLDENMIEMVAPRTTGATAGWLVRLLDTHDDPNTHVLIRGPQGCGKSTKIMQNIPEIYERDRGVIFFSSPSIAQAQEKVETFARVNQDEQFVPFLYLSLTALYERFCPEEDRVAHEEILQQGGSSWLRAIYERQREIYEQMFAYRLGLVGLRDARKIPVLFGTHETMRQHVAENTTRIFYAKDFCDRWFEPLAKEERQKWQRHLIDQNRFHRVIVDEVTAHDLLSIHPYSLVEWVRWCAEEIKFDHTSDIAEQFQRFTSCLNDHPCARMTWNVFLDVLNSGYGEEHVVEVSGREIPYDDRNGIYGRLVGQRYVVRPRGWWNSFWRVTMLTTEAVPTRIIEAIDREAAARGEQQDDRIKVYEIGLPDSARDFVRLELHRACQKQTLDELVRAYRAGYPKAEVISDMVKSRISEFEITTHMSAKGSNSYIDRDIVAFYNALSPALFGELGALNGRFGCSDLVRLFYVDRFDQTCGRNRGFRGERGREHIAVFPPRLNDWLAPAMSSASYVLVKAKPSVDFN